MQIIKNGLQFSKVSTMKKHEITFSIIKIPLDFLTVFLSFFIAKELREVTDLIPGVSLPIQTISNDALFWFALFGAILCILVFAIHWLYSIKISHSKLGEVFDVIWYSLYFFMFFSLFVYLSNGILYTNEIPRLVILFATLIACTWMLIERQVLNSLQTMLLNMWIIKKRKILIVSNKKHSKNRYILEDIQKANIYKILGYINTEKVSDAKLKYLGSIKDFFKLAEAWEVDEILYVDSDFSKKELYSIWDESRIYGIRYRYITNSFDITSANTTLTLINSIPVIEIKNTTLENWWRVAKRLFDLIFSLIFLVIAMPIMLITAFALKIEDPKAAVIFKNKRIGLKGKSFFLYKFRYMKNEFCVDEENKEALEYEKELIKKQSNRAWPLYKIKNDPRKTRVWTFIEEYSIDELPQLFNVIIGNMSLVWPRPHQPREVDKYELYQRRVFTVKPWITGMAQINGREKNTFDKEVKLDIFYIENWSLLLDIKIIYKTFPILFQR